ncbi:hypothetical protein [Streptomyces luteireticuli]|uniref:hypothetical protein n=1 Tax=Streptomyces luteireticuli TaxID=173858 RepID=UPI0035567B63
MTKKKRPRRHQRPPLLPHSVPGIGTTWVARGLPYWWRRCRLALFWLFLTALTGVMAAGFLWGMAEESTLVLAIALVLYTPACAGAVCVAVNGIREADGKDAFWEPKSRALKTTAIALGSVAAVALALLGAFEVAIALPLFCFAFPNLLRSLARHSPGEREARRYWAGPD